jgi:hypothetical protein
MEYSIHISNERDRADLLPILRALYEAPGTNGAYLFLIKTIIRRIRRDKPYRLLLKILGQKHLHDLLNNIPGMDVDFTIYDTIGYYLGVREKSFEVYLSQDEMTERLEVLERMVSFAQAYRQEAFIESALIDEEQVNEEVEIGVKNEFGYEVSPFFVFELAERKNIREAAALVLEAGIEGFTYKYDKELDTAIILVCFLSDYRSPGMSIEEGLEQFTQNVLTLISSNESKRLFKSRQPGFRKIRLARYGAGKTEKGYEEFLHTIRHEAESYRRNH